MGDCIGKHVLHRSNAACLAACLVMVLLWPLGNVPVQAASVLEDGSLWIGDTQVTDSNCADIFGDGTASYDPATLTLTLNGVHIGPGDCHIEDEGGAAQTQMSRTEEDWGIHSLYAKNTVANLVIKGNNTFETPAVEREMYTDDAEGIGGQIKIWDGIVIDNRGIDADAMSITGSGTLKSLVPAIRVEKEYDKADKKGSLPLDEGQGGVGLYWFGASGKTLTIGTPGGEGPELDLRGGIAGLAVNTTTDVYNADLTVQAFKGNDYGCYYSPHAYPFYNKGMVTIYENTKMKANLADGGNNSDESEIYDTYNFSNEVTLRDEDDYNTFWYSDESDDAWVIWGTQKQMEEAEAAAGRADLGLDPTAEDYAQTDIDVQGFTEDATIYSVDVEWGAMTFQYENSTWDATAHKTVDGAGWKVYDSTKNEALDSTTDDINKIQVTNHSNADVWAVLAYTAADDYTDTSGSFGVKDDDVETDYHASGEYLALGTADNAENVGTAGIPTVGTVYFMPDGIADTYRTANGIAKWSQLGTITVSIQTEEP